MNRRRRSDKRRYVNSVVVASRELPSQASLRSCFVPPGEGLAYALLANLTPNVKVVPLAPKAGEQFVAPNLDNVYKHRYSLSRYVYIFVNKAPGKPLPPKIKEFLKAVLSRDGQEVVAKEGVYIPLTPEVVREELGKLEEI